MKNTSDVLLKKQGDTLPWVYPREWLMYTNKEFGIQESNLWLAYFGVGGGQKPCQPPVPVLTGTSFEGWRVISYTTIPAELILIPTLFLFYSI